MHYCSCHIADAASVDAAAAAEAATDKHPGSYRKEMIIPKNFQGMSASQHYKQTHKRGWRSNCDKTLSKQSAWLQQHTQICTHTSVHTQVINTSVVQMPLQIPVAFTKHREEETYSKPTEENQRNTTTAPRSEANKTDTNQTESTEYMILITYQENHVRSSNYPTEKF